ncbi:hypothetical protein D9Q98_003603 [Chlorella vulgaris]|uniref:Uncharacterized protein n=1 Tax=Chlorella vulgaris TaxID=3077 RepID=A0A9D4TSW6_CHLVU|nr:hypothetical protein D9Q98_003603 [Chlorella vulgaris]
MDILPTSTSTGTTSRTERGGHAQPRLGARRLAQVVAESPVTSVASAILATAPSPEAETGRTCFGLNRQLGFICSVTIDRVATHFPRGSTELPTEAEQQRALESLAAAGLPDTGCCSIVERVAEDDLPFWRFETRWAVDPALTAPYLEGVNLILAAACQIPITECL